MSWLNKFLKMFQEKDEIYDYERSIVEYNQEIKNDKKELETRVTYYYPKGQKTTLNLSKKEDKPQQTNRVLPKREKREIRKQNSKKEEGLALKPLASDRSERKNARHEKKMNQQEQIQPEMKPKAEILPVKYVEQHNPKAQSEPKKLEQRIETRTKVTKKSSRPFRPTEIPSPIYGFSKRPHQAEVVEFELTSDEKLLEIEQRIFSISKVEQAATIYNEEDATSSTELLEEVFEEKEIVIEDSDFLHDEIQEDLEEELDVSFEFNDSLEVEQEKEIIIEDSDFFHDEIQEDLEEELDVSFESNDGLVMEQEKEQVMTIENLLATTEIDKEIERSIPPNIEMVKTLKENNLQIDNEIESNNEDNEKKPTQRSHLPFNVLMLNQDKRNWEQKRIEKAVKH